MRIESPILKGSFIAAGLWLDGRTFGAAAAAERLLRAMWPGDTLYRDGDVWIVQFKIRRRLLSFESPAGLLIAHQNGLVSALIKDAEIVNNAALIVLEGKCIEVILNAEHRVHPASHLDLSDFERVDEVNSLGSVYSSVNPDLPAVQVNLREKTGIGEPDADMQEMAEALRGVLRQEGESQESSPERVGGGWTAALFQAVGRFLQGIAGLLSRPSASSKSPSARGAGASGENNSLIVFPGKKGAGSSSIVSGKRSSPGWIEQLATSLSWAAARFLAWSQFSSIITRRQSEYVARMFQMFDDGDLEAALRHAIPLGTGESAPAPPMLGTPSPRADLTITPHRQKASSSLYSSGDLQEELRRRYRAAFEQLEKKGEIEKAAFVLSELLKVDEEAVAFLEKHKRYSLAAELAEARGLGPAVVVRLWFLAGDIERAVRIAKLHGAFGEAVIRLTAMGNMEQAAALRLLWADSLASAGQYVAAVDAVWPIEKARRLAKKWIDNAVATGGPPGAAVLIKKAELFQNDFDDVYAQAEAFLNEEPPYGIENATAMAGAILRAGREKSIRVLAKAITRALMSIPTPNENVSPLALAQMSGDALFIDEVSRALSKKSDSTIPDILPSFSGLNRTGPRSINNCARVILPNLSYGRAIKLGSDTFRLFGIVDGLTSFSNPEHVCELVREVIEDYAYGYASAARDVTTAGHLLAWALLQANGALLQRAADRPQHRGDGAVAAVGAVRGKTFVFAHVGNCRIYLRRDTRQIALTADHTLGAETKGQEHKLLPGVHVESLKHVLTRLMGVTDHLKVDVGSVELGYGDLICFCNDGIHQSFTEDEIASAIGSPDGAPAICSRLVQMSAEKGNGKDAACVVMRFQSKGMRQHRPLEPFTIAFNPKEHLPHWVATQPVIQRTIRRTKAQSGSLPIFDAVSLPNGQMLAAMGTLGAWLLSREGRVLTRFMEPASSIVLSDQGDRAIFVDGSRVTRVDLIGKRQEPWCHLNLKVWADTFDGLIWYVAAEGALGRDNKVLALDATQVGVHSLWNFGDNGRTVRRVFRRPTSLAMIFGAQAPISRDGSVDFPDNYWEFDLPSHKLKSRAEMERAKTERELTLRGWTQSTYPTQWDSETGTFQVRLSGESEPHLTFVLEGASRVSARFRGDELTLCDDMGRLIVVMVKEGRIVRECTL
ncbi:MAG: hypothetical protein IPK82_01905 [Polyangiaceae bacterium]|nr:hypothetical protein [Polyangiaceae bacterium]